MLINLLIFLFFSFIQTVLLGISVILLEIIAYLNVGKVCNRTSIFLKG